MAETYEPYRQDDRPGRVPEITERQQDVLDCIKAHVAEFGFAPTQRELAKRMNFGSSRTAATHLRELHAKGAIVISRRRARAIQIVNQQPMSA